MKHLKHITENFQKINENLSFPLFKNEKQLKEKLITNKDFANGDVSDAITDVIYDRWHLDNNMNYNAILEWTKNEYGMIPYFSMMFSLYDGQVCNGGHLQYYDNGYASSNSRGFGQTYENIDIHEDFVDTFKKLNLENVLKDGDIVYNIISSFTLDLDSDIEECDNCGGSGWINCESCNGEGHVKCNTCDGYGEDDDGNRCSECDGDGVIDCDECYGKGDARCGDCDGSGEYDTGNMIPDTSYWNDLDLQWYKINESIRNQYDDYLKTLILDGEEIKKLVEFANSSQKYNI